MFAGASELSPFSVEYRGYESSAFVFQGLFTPSPLANQGTVMGGHYEVYSATHPAAHLKRPETPATTTRDAVAVAEVFDTLATEETVRTAWRMKGYDRRDGTANPARE